MPDSIIAIPQLAPANKTASSSEARRLTRPGRALLDLIRAVAAIYVMASHAFGGAIAQLAQEAVIAFFILSGFVVFYNEEEGKTGYWKRRLRRIYPTLIGAMLISIVIAWANEELYKLNLKELVGTIIGLQDNPDLKPGVLMPPFLGNSPLWSLAYEMWFYVLFPPILQAYKRWPKETTHAVGFSCCVFYLTYVWMPNHFSLVGSYFLLWWAGAMAADSFKRGVYFPRRVYGWMMLWCVVASVPFIIAPGTLGAYPALPFRHMFGGLIMLLIAETRIRHLFAKLADWLRHIATTTASISFGIYVVHWPLLNQSQLVKNVGLPISMLLVAVCAWIIDALPSRLFRRRANAK